MKNEWTNHQIETTFMNKILHKNTPVTTTSFTKFLNHYHRYFLTTDVLCGLHPHAWCHQKEWWKCYEVVFYGSCAMKIPMVVFFWFFGVQKFGLKCWMEGEEPEVVIRRYFLINRLYKLHTFCSSFFSLLPHRVKQQNVGWVTDPDHKWNATPNVKNKTTKSTFQQHNQTKTYIYYTQQKQTKHRSRNTDGTIENNNGRTGGNGALDVPCTNSTRNISSRNIKKTVPNK